MEILIPVIIVYGSSAIITNGSIFKPLRDFAEQHNLIFWEHNRLYAMFTFMGGIFVSFVMDYK